MDSGLCSLLLESLDTSRCEIGPGAGDRHEKPSPDSLVPASGSPGDPMPVGGMTLRIGGEREEAPSQLTQLKLFQIPWWAGKKRDR